MNPLKRKILVEKTAEQLSLPVQTVDEIVSFYYKTVQKTLSSAEHPSVNVPNLGTFVVKQKTLEEKIKKNILFVQKIETNEDISVSTYELIMQKRKDIAGYLHLLETINAEKKRKEEVKLKKQIFKDGKSN